MSVAPPGGEDRIMIYGPKADGTYIVEFRTAAGEAGVVSLPLLAQQRGADARLIQAAKDVDLAP
jgi:hypothetical protein